MGMLLFLCMLIELESVSDVRKVYDFANYLYKSREYRSALIEYERVLFLMGGGEGEASGYIEEEIDTSSVFMQIGRCYLLLGDYPSARHYLSRVNNDTSNALIGFSFLEEHNLCKAESFFVKISDEVWYSCQESYFSCLRGLPYKSPLIAGLSSALLPGVGRVYSGRLGDGIFSFIFTVGSLALSYHYYDSGNQWAGVSFGVLGLLFYLGDIYGSVEAVHLHNAKRYYEAVDKFRSAFGYLYY